MSDLAINGFCHEQFAPIREAFEKNFSEQNDVGASVAVTVEGEMVVDLWGGHLDEQKTQAWQENSIVNVYSTTKTMTALCALILADREQLDFNAPVAKYWPEFAQNGKEAVLVKHLMSHSAGLSGTDVALTGEDLYDWDKVCNALAAQKPWWEPGTQSGYHALTQGYLIGEVVRRITGKTLGTYFREEVAEPLNVDFHIGVDPKHFSRIGDLIPPGGDQVLGQGLDDASIAARSFKYPGTSALASRTEGWRRAEIPAANGHGNARAVAKTHAILANGGSAWGTTLLSPETAASVMQEQTNGMDLALGMPIRFGLGFGLNSEAMPLSPNPNTCFWGGWGGSLIVIDQDARTTISYVMNRMNDGLMGDMRGALLGMALATSLA